MNLSITYLLAFAFTIVICENVSAQTVKRVVLDSSDNHSGYYLVVEPKSDTISGVLVLLAGFGQRADDTPPETKLHKVAYANGILTVFYAGGNKMYADSVTNAKLSAVMKDVLRTYAVKSSSFVLGGYSAGGMIAMRYVELCNEFPKNYPIQPRGVFIVDSPIDVFTIYDQLEESARNKYSELATDEAVRIMGYMKADFGIPKENKKTYAALTAFSMDKNLSQNEKFLVNTAVRTYHDVDIAWRITNRNQTVHNSNYEVTAELINRLVLMGNKNAEFMQTFQTGYRANGQRHPHSWSIVNEVELVQWLKKCIQP